MKHVMKCLDCDKLLTVSVNHRIGKYSGLPAIILDMRCGCGGKRYEFAPCYIEGVLTNHFEENQFYQRKERKRRTKKNDNV